MTISEEIIKVLDALGNKLGLAIDWTAENVMPYAQELFERLINFEIATSIFYIVLWPLFVIIFLIIARYACSYAKKIDYEPDYPSTWVLIFSVIFAIALAIVSIIVIPIQAFDIITCCVFPEKQILNYLLQVQLK